MNYYFSAPSFRREGAKASTYASRYQAKNCQYQGNNNNTNGYHLPSPVNVPGTG